MLIYIQPIKGPESHFVFKALLRKLTMAPFFKVDLIT